MSKFNYIINPKTKEKISLFGREGGQLLSTYVNVYKKIRTESNNTENIKK